VEMRSEHIDAWFSADLPADGLPCCDRLQSKRLSHRGTLNNIADSHLEERLRSSGLKYFRATGGAQDGSHQEPGFGIVTHDREIVRAISCEFHQEAFFWVEDGVIFCERTARTLRQRVGVWSERQMQSSPSRF